jgi:tripartite-type tricarboxylate transporter receptor subunit TctC
MISIAQSISPAIYPKLGFDPVRDFSHVTLLATLPSLLVVHPAVPAKNVQELIAFAKAKPGVLNYASGGSGTSSHLLMEMFNVYGGIKTVHIAYKGTGPALTDQLSGVIEVAFSTAIAVQPYVQSGRLRALAVSTKQRLPTLPEVPTIDESGLAGFDGGSWQGVVMPAGTPRDVVNEVSVALVGIIKSPEMRERILAMGGIPLGNSPDEFAAFMKAESEKWAQVAKAANVKME